MIRIFIFILGLAPALSYTQYEIFTKNREYKPLSDTAYSICVENNFQIADYEKEIEFGFDMPYFGKSYSKMLAYGKSIYIISNDPDSDFLISLFADEYQNKGYWEEVLISDWKYENVKVSDEKECLVIEHKNVSFYFEQSFFGPDHHYLNFQSWFCNDGSISLHFGDTDVEDANFFIQGIGSFLVFEGDTFYFGPYIELINPDDPDDYIGIAKYQDSIYMYNAQNLDENSFFPYTMPAGTELGFRLKSNSTVDKVKNDTIKLYPNPCHDVVRIQLSAVPIDPLILQIYDLQGKIVDRHTFNVVGNGTIEHSVEQLPSGNYVLTLLNAVSGNFMFITQFAKL